MKTRAEVEALKANWLEDPCYDLEDVEGFEEFREELLAFRRDLEFRRFRGDRERRAKRAWELGIHGNLELVAYLERLEARIAKLEGE